MASRGARVVRGLVASSIAVFVAALAHVAGGGTMPGAAGLSLAFAFAALASIALAGRRVSRLRLAVTVILSQGLFHVMFLMAGGAATTAATVPGMQMGAPAMSVTAGPAMVYDGWMWAAHGVAAVITIVALVWGEKAFWGLFAAVLRVCRVGVVVLRQGREPIRIAVGKVVLLDDVLVGSLHRRGPPAAAASS